MDARSVQIPTHEGVCSGGGCLRVQQYVRDRSTGFFFVVCGIYKPLMSDNLATLPFGASVLSGEASSLKRMRNFRFAHARLSPCCAQALWSTEPTV
eukprot:4043067-Pleurochrysis_carterae.AAC.2